PGALQAQSNPPYPVSRELRLISTALWREFVRRSQSLRDGMCGGRTIQKPIRILPSLVLLPCAGAAAYYSYAVNFAPVPLHSTSGGPPAGISMPKMGSTPKGENREGKAPRPSRGKRRGQ